MDISCIISSGDLELYVLGMLSQEDNVKVAQLAQLFPEIKKEIDDIQQSLLQMSDEADDAADVPSAAVRETLFRKLRTMPAETADSADVITDNKTFEATDNNQAKVIAMKPKRTFTTLSLVASVLALIACLAAIIHLSSANTHYHEVADNLQKQVNQLQQTAQTQNQNLALYQDTAYQKINLTNVPGKPKALVQLFWNRTTRDVYAADISLPAAPAGKQYQLWALIDGKPVSAGLITGKTLPQKMNDFARADAFAITLEKAGGSATPTLTEMYVLGKTS